MIRLETHAWAQVVLFVDDKTVSKGMVKYASAIPRESILDISGEVSVPEVPVGGCSCSQVRLLAWRASRALRRIRSLSPTARRRLLLLPDSLHLGTHHWQLCRFGQRLMLLRIRTLPSTPRMMSYNAPARLTAGALARGSMPCAMITNLCTT